MSALDFLLPWEQQPWELAGINWDHPRASGLCFFMPGGDALGMRDLVRNQPLTLTGLGAGVVTSQGPSRLFGTSSYADFTPPPEIGANTPFSVSWTQEARSTSGYSTVLSVNFGTAGTHYQFVIYQGTAANAYRFSAGPRRSSGAHSWATTIGAVTNNRLDRFVLRAAAGSQSTTSSGFTLWRNGVLIAQDTTTAFSINQTAGARIGANSDGGGADPWEGAILDMRMWPRILSDEEAFEESQIQSAAALYTPRRIWVPVSSGAATHTTTGVLAGAGATIAGTAVHKTRHTTTGVLAGAGATIAGTADHTTPGGATHTTTGVLAGAGATIAGTAVHKTLHTTTGALAGGGAALSGTAIHYVKHTTTGVLAGAGATIAGAAVHSGASGNYSRNPNLYLDIGGGLSLMLGNSRMPSWDTAGRPAAPLDFTFGFNTDTNAIEVWNGSSWV